MQKLHAISDSFKSPSSLSGLNASEPILVAFSGGSDSCALLFMLCEYAKQSGAKIYAAHLNHGIRGAEADRDEQFCSEFSKELGVVFFSKKLDIPSIAKDCGESVETVARRERYKFFDTLMLENGIKILATAHNADDNLETVLFNLTRGAGLGGLCGIPEARAVAHGVVIRPILTMEKKDILAFCDSHGLEFVTDSTNFDTDYTRNKIRNDIVPLLKEINSGVVSNVSRTTQSLREDSLCLKSMTEWFTDELASDLSIETEKLCGSPAAIVNRALMQIYESVSDGKTLEAVHISAIKELARKGVPHSSLSLPNGIDAVIENKRLCFVKKQEKSEVLEFSTEISEGKNEIKEANAIIFADYNDNSKNIYKNSTQLSIDSAKIKGTLFARSRAAGDKILLGGMHKSVKKLMCDKKLPLFLRSRLPIICDDDGIVAIPFVAIRDGAEKKSKEKNEGSKKLWIYLL